MYEYLIFDADHTLIDFNRDEKAAFERTFAHFGASYTEADVHRAWVLSYTVWAEHGLNDIHLEEIQRTFHEKYVSHLPYLFKRIKDGFDINASAQELSDYFLEELNATAFVLGNGLEVFKNLSKRYKTCIATNGLTVMQTARLKEFLPYAHGVFISEEFGIIKPNKSFFSGMLCRLNAKAENCLFVGDSLTSDVAGAKTVGMPCVWFNPDKKPLPKGYAPIGQIFEIEQVEKFL